jgi:putative phosphoribosyl transferase
MRTRYRDRHEAGRLLADDVSAVLGKPCAVAGIPRGGAIVGAEIAIRLHAPFTLALVRKITLERAPELAVGAMDQDGHAVVDYGVVAMVGGNATAIARARETVRAEIQRQQARFNAPDLAALVTSRTVVLVDDGLATGLTMRCAVAFARRHGAQEVIVAAPCGSREAVELLGLQADRVICPWAVEDFGAVGAYYETFTQTGDAEVIAALESARAALKQADGA